MTGSPSFTDHPSIVPSVIVKAELRHQYCSCHNLDPFYSCYNVDSGVPGRIKDRREDLLSGDPAEIFPRLKAPEHRLHILPPEGAAAERARKLIERPQRKKIPVEICPRDPPVLHREIRLEEPSLPAAAAGEGIPRGTAEVPFPCGVLFVRSRPDLLQLGGEEPSLGHPLPREGGFEVGPKVTEAHRFRQKIADIADAALHRLRALRPEFGGVNPQRPRHHLRIGVEEKGPMVQDPPPAEPLRRARNLAPLHQNIVAAGRFGMKPQPPQRLPRPAG